MTRFWLTVYNYNGIGSNKPDRLLPLGRLWESPVPYDRTRPVDPVPPAAAAVAAGGAVSVEGWLVSDLLRSPGPGPGPGPAPAWPLAAVVIVSLRTFLCDWKAMMCSLGPKRQTSATVALNVTDTHRVVSCTCRTQTTIFNTVKWN